MTGCGDSCHLKIKSDSLPDGTVGEEYSFSLESECGGDEWFLQSGNLPPGISLSSDGDLSGTPTLAGIYTFTIGLLDYESDDYLFDDQDNESENVADYAYKGFSILIEECQE